MNKDTTGQAEILGIRKLFTSSWNGRDYSIFSKKKYGILIPYHYEQNNSERMPHCVRGVRTKSKGGMPAKLMAGDR
ncbi:MAG: hypothetical protein NPIRA04_28670 [Nitrospirales bacterium]|nr:MAG: hypothetical protein NPIRA04_28670 [Nitrospirales bacterium]